ncbi:hypothetical protein CDL15_Pgr001404 [Punica granatum]|uniref:Pectinesterase inhibitor domain-containing protein n=1 Tax=Punica granatum TaxID=22663 RepID=A0A218WLQ5_PUNGR|nr:hypothetical protein CDL15_Pgr001404 [Punica granatum]PKI55699.1 hypothetical protein CRG98_023915 [Punica granatum]
MASSYSSTYMVVVALILAVVCTDPIVASDPKEVARICSRSLEPEACKECVFSDPSRGIDDIPQLIYTAVFCMYTQMVYAHDHADGLAQNTTSGLPGHRTALQVCSKVLFGASNTLGDALTMVEDAKYYDAYSNVKRSRWALISCDNAFGKFAKDVVVPNPLVDDMTLTKRLFDVVHYFFSLIIKINP